MHVLIATPTAGGMATTAYTQSVVAATIAINERGGRYQFYCVDGADVIMARNMLAHFFLSDPALTHILFIDNDMSVEQGVFERFLKADLPMVAAAYSQRRMDLEAFAHAMSEDGDAARARALASRFSVKMPSGKVEVTNHLCKVTAIGFGCVLIKRAVFEAMIAREIVAPYVSSTVRRMGITGNMYDFFGKIPLENGDWLSEDYAFCDRVGALGDVEVMAYVGPGIGHVGQFTYSGPFIERLKAGKV